MGADTIDGLNTDTLYELAETSQISTPEELLAAYQGVHGTAQEVRPNSLEEWLSYRAEPGIWFNPEGRPAQPEDFRAYRLACTALEWAQQHTHTVEN